MGKLLSPPGPRTAHLCIDMQNLFAPGAPWATPWMERVMPLAVDPKAERFTGAGADAANAMLRREYRAPFVVPELAT